MFLLRASRVQAADGPANSGFYTISQKIFEINAACISYIDTLWLCHPLTLFVQLPSSFTSICHCLLASCCPSPVLWSPWLGRPQCSKVFATTHHQTTLFVKSSMAKVSLPKQNHLPACQLKIWASKKQASFRSSSFSSAIATCCLTTKRLRCSTLQKEQRDFRCSTIFHVFLISSNIITQWRNKVCPSSEQSSGDRQSPRSHSLRAAAKAFAFSSFLGRRNWEIFNEERYAAEVREERIYGPMGKRWKKEDHTEQPWTKVRRQTNTFFFGGDPPVSHCSSSTAEHSNMQIGGLGLALSNLVWVFLLTAAFRLLSETPFLRLSKPTSVLYAWASLNKSHAFLFFWLCKRETYKCIHHLRFQHWVDQISHDCPSHSQPIWATLHGNKQQGNSEPQTHTNMVWR